MGCPRCLVLVHVFYPELWEQIAQLLRRLDITRLDLRVNLVEGRTNTEWRHRLSKEFPRARVVCSPNLGQDVGGTLNLLKNTDLNHYDLVCKLHTKKSEYTPNAARWRTDLVRACLADPLDVFSIFAERPEVTMLGSAKWITTGNGINHRACLRLCDRLAIDQRLAASPWVAGCMFWCRPYVMQRLKDAGFQQHEFKVAYGRDGTLAHAVERIFGALARERGELYWRNA